MRWPWQRSASGDQLVLAWSQQTLAFVRARAQREGGFEIMQMGVERQGADSMDTFIARLDAAGLRDGTATAMLRPDQYHLLQVPAPAVPPEELKSAARYQIRDMIDSHIDDITLDVLHVGDGQQKNNPQLFVVAAKNADVRAVMELAGQMDWSVEVIDVQETCQRNLQTALAQRAGSAERADACMVLSDDNHALITISAKGELYYTRRLDLPEGFLTMTWIEGNTVLPDAPDGYTPVTEYVPDYSGETAAFGTTALSDSDRAQRLVVEVQRTLDLWDRTWSSLPLSGLQVYAGKRSAELATWLARETGQAVSAMELDPLFAGLADRSDEERSLCLPLLGLLLRQEKSSS